MNLRSRFRKELRDILPAFSILFLIRLQCAKQSREVGVVGLGRKFDDVPLTVPVLMEDVEDLYSRSRGFDNQREEWRENRPTEP